MTQGKNYTYLRLLGMYDKYSCLRSDGSTDIKPASLYCAISQTASESGQIHSSVSYIFVCQQIFGFGFGKSGTIHQLMHHL